MPRKLIQPVILTIVFALSRRLYAVAGLHFQVATITSSWHFIDIHLLKTDLWRSVFYLHTQPPLLNLLTGLGLQLFPTTYERLFQAAFLLIGLVFALSIYFLGNKLGFSNNLSLVLAMWFCLSPSAIVYENIYSYVYPLPAALTLSAVFLARFLETRRPPDGLFFSLLLACLALTWSLFHLTWLLGCFAIVWFALKDARRKALWLLPALLLVTAWYAKNALLYGTFSASTWGGLNLFKIVTYDISGETRKAWVKEGNLSALSLVPPFRSPEVYLRYFPQTPLTGIPLLDEYETSTGYRNQHHRVYVLAGEQYWNDSLRMIALAPHAYLRSVLRAAYIFFHSASDYKQIMDIRHPIDPLDTLWNRLFYGQWLKDETLSERAERFSPGHFAWLLTIGFFLALGGGLAYLWQERARLSRPRPALLLFLLWNVVFVSLVSVTMDIGENNRFRFTIDAILLLMLVFALRYNFQRTVTPPSQSTPQNGRSFPFRHDANTSLVHGRRYTARPLRPAARLPLRAKAGWPSTSRNAGARRALQAMRRLSR